MSNYLNSEMYWQVRDQVDNFRNQEQIIRCNCCQKCHQHIQHVYSTLCAESHNQYCQICHPPPRVIVIQNPIIYSAEPPRYINPPIYRRY